MTSSVVLLDTLDGVVISDAERASLTWLAGFEAHTVEDVAAVIPAPGRPVLWSERSPERMQRPGDL